MRVTRRRHLEQARIRLELRAVFAMWRGAVCGERTPVQLPNIKHLDAFWDRMGAAYVIDRIIWTLVSVLLIEQPTAIERARLVLGHSNAFVTQAMRINAVRVQFNKLCPYVDACWPFQTPCGQRDSMKKPASKSRNSRPASWLGRILAERQTFPNLDH